MIAPYSVVMDLVAKNHPVLAGKFNPDTGTVDTGIVTTSLTAAGWNGEAVRILSLIACPATIAGWVGLELAARSPTRKYPAYASDIKAESGTTSRAPDSPRSGIE